MMPQIGEVVLRKVRGEWQEDWLRQALLGDESAVLVWGEHRDRYKPSHEWKSRTLTAEPERTKYTNPNGLWLTGRWGFAAPRRLDLPIEPEPIRDGCCL